METHQKTIVYVICIGIIVSLVAGCGEPVKVITDAARQVDPGTTIGSLCEVFALELIPAEGYGLVGGLRGTGSPECPPRLRKYLTQYILTQLPRDKVDVEKLITSRNTAVVHVRGIMPAAVTKNQYFDLKVEALPGTRTTSLEGGWLYSAELKAAGSFNIDLKVLATVEGAKKLLSLIKTYFDLGGFHVQFNCVSSETLRQAQLHPEEYRDLIVRVAGFSAFFVHLDREVQDEIIKRTELVL